MTQGTGERRLFGASVGFIVAYQWFRNHGLNLTLGVDATYYTLKQSVTLNNGASVNVPDFSGMVPSLELNVGYAILLRGSFVL